MFETILINVINDKAVLKMNLQRLLSQHGDFSISISEILLWLQGLVAAICDNILSHTTLPLTNLWST